MNESLYRIVFNKARGCMMAVSELASSHSSGKDKHHSAAARSFGRSHSQFHSTNQSGTVFDDSFGKPKPVVKAISNTTANEGVDPVNELAIVKVVNA